MLSVLITCYNQSNIVISNVDNILKNTKDLDIDIIISDDYSSDESYEKLLKHYENIDNVLIVQPELNLGVSNNRNTLIKYADKKYSLFIDGDDIQADDYISTIYKELDNDDIYYIKTFTEIWSETEHSVKDSLRYDNVFLYVFKTECLKTRHFVKELEIGEDLEFGARYHDYIMSGKKTIDVSYFLNRQEDNISLTKNGDKLLRYNRDKLLLDYLLQYESNGDELLNGKINQKKIDLINIGILIGLDPQFNCIDISNVSKKHKLSYRAYRFFRILHLQFIYKKLVDKFIGYKI